MVTKITPDIRLIAPLPVLPYVLNRTPVRSVEGERTQGQEG